MEWHVQNYYLDDLVAPLTALTDAGWTIFTVIPRGDNMCTVIANRT